MKKILTLVCALMLCTASFTACSDKSGSSSKDSDSSKVQTTKATTTKSTEQSEASAPVTTQSESAEPSESERPLEKLISVFPDGDSATGYVGKADGDVDTALINTGVFNVKTLSLDTIKEDNESGENANTYYKFEMLNSSPATTIKSGDKTYYASELTLDGNKYFVCFADDSTSEEEAQTYTTPGSQLTYWAFCTKIDGSSGYDYMLVPAFCGNETAGYYAVKPALELTGVDCSCMSTLSPLTFDSSDKTEAGTAPAPAPSNSTSQDLIFESYTQSSIGADIQFTFKNTYPTEVWIDNLKFTLNGKDITDDTSAYISAKKGETMSDVIYLGSQIKKGDVITISGEMVDTTTYDTIENVSYSFTVES